MTTASVPVEADRIVQVRRGSVDRFLIGIGAVVTVAFIVAGALLMWGANFADDYVHRELSSQNITFPSADELREEGRDDLALRISVQPGGCSGLRYQLFFDERSLDGDVVTDFDGVSVVVDRMSVPYLNGAMIDFVDSIEKQGFTIDNPNATGSCACGDSFH